MSFKTNLATYAIIASLGLSSLSGCSYTKPKIGSENEIYFPVGTEVYSMSEGHADSLYGGVKLKKVVGKSGKKVREDRYSVKTEMADKLNLRKKFSTGYDAVIIESSKEDRIENKVKSKKTLEAKTNKWYNKPIFGIQGITAKNIFATSAALTSIYFISDMTSKHNDKKHSHKQYQDTPKEEYNLPEEPADVGVIWENGDEGRTGGARE